LNHFLGGSEIGLRRGRQHGLRTLARKAERDCAPDPATSTGNHYNFSGKFTRHVAPSLLCNAGFAFAGQSGSPGRNQSQ
jgi:hypothetical protein